MLKDPILIIDDIISARKLYSALLTQKGHFVKDVDNGATAIELLKIENFSLIITDLNMPHINGVGVLTWLAKRDVNTPVIVISATSDKKTVLKTAQFNVCKFFTKPINTMEFLNTVDEIVGHPNLREINLPPSPIINNRGNTSSFKQAMKNFSKKNSILSTSENWTPARFVQELLGIPDTKLKNHDLSTLHKVHLELKLWKNSPKLENSKDVFHTAFQKGSLPVKLLCIEYLPETLPPNDLMSYFKEWIFARDHRARIKVVERLRGIKHKDAIKILLASEQDNVKSIRDAAVKILSKHRLSHLVIPVIIYYSERNLPLPAKYNRLLFHTNNQLVYEELENFIRKASPIQLCYLADAISRNQWHDGLLILFRLGQNESEMVRLHTIEAISRFKEYSTCMHLTKLFNDPIYEVRLAAINALAESPLIKKGTKLFLLLFDSKPSSIWDILGDIVKDLEKSNSLILDFCNNLHGSSMEKRLESFLFFNSQNSALFKKHAKLLLNSSERERSSTTIQFLQDFNYD